MFRMLNKRGQNTAEYAILIGVIVAAAIAMQVYVRRGMQARVKDAVDTSLNMTVQADGQDVFSTPQYEPYYMDQDTVTRQDSQEREGMTVGGGVGRNLEYENLSRTGTMVAGNWSQSAY